MPYLAFFLLSNTVIAAALVAGFPASSFPSNIFLREATTCGGDSSLSQCGGSFPSDFCCPSSATCMALNSSSSKAVLCCPKGSDCSYIQPITCDQTAQNATLNPTSQFHSDPTEELATCGDACCPMGASCVQDQCAISTTSAVTSASTSSSTTFTSSTPGATTTIGSATSSPSTTPTTTTSNTQSQSTTSSSTSAVITTIPSNDADFNSKSFAAGFIPGIFLGALLIGLLLWYLSHRRNKRPYTDEKNNYSRDQLTDLSTMSNFRPAMHDRSISEPTIDPTGIHRTDFLRSTPPQLVPEGGNTYNVSATGPVTPSRTPKAVRALFAGSRSPLFPSMNPATPIPTQSPLPAHLKRGTLAFTISPIRTLKTKKSMHSLRRQMTSASRGSSSTTNRRADLSRSGSTETIQVLMPSAEPYTPDQRGQPHDTTLSASRYQHPATTNSATSSWRTQTSASFSSNSDSTAVEPTRGPYPVASSIYSPQQQQHITPTRQSSNHQSDSNTLGTPYTPSRYNGPSGVPEGQRGRMPPFPVRPEMAEQQLGTVREMREGDADRENERERPVTTFSGLMERAGMRQEDFVDFPQPPVPSQQQMMAGKGNAGKRWR